MASVNPEQLKKALESPADFWNARYGDAEFAYGTEPNAWLKHSVESSGQLGGPTSSLDVVDLGAGEGRNAVFVAKHGHSVFTVDMSAEGERPHLHGLF